MTTPKICQKAPYFKDEKAGKRAWCACGLSKNDPYCDGSHTGTGLMPMLVDIDSDKRVVWCGCKHSKNKPYCDGTHGTL